MSQNRNSTVNRISLVSKRGVEVRQRVDVEDEYETKGLFWIQELYRGLFDGQEEKGQSGGED